MREERPEINIHMNTPEIQGFDFKDMSVSTCKVGRCESDDEMTADTTVWHPRISPFR